MTRFGGIGDVLICLNGLGQLKRRHPNLRISFYTHTSLGDLARLQVELDEVVTADRFEDFDCERMGILGLVPYFEIYPSRSHGSGHVVDRLAYILNLDRPERVHRMEIGATVRSENFATIHVTPSWSPYKAWRFERWQEIADRLREQGLSVCQIGGGSDEALEGVEDCRGLPVAESIELMKAARLHVGVDSFTNHVTNILPLTPSVIIWGPTSSASFGYSHNQNIEIRPACSPCYRAYDSANRLSLCPHDRSHDPATPDAPCTGDIGVERVWDGIEAILSA